MAGQNNGRGQAAAAATQSKGLPVGFKAYTPFPFSGMNVKDAPGAIDDKEFIYLENWLRIGNGKLRTAWDIGPVLYSAPPPLTIVSYFFYTIGTTYYVAVFLSDGSAVQVTVNTGAQVQIGPATTFYSAIGKQLPACTQWGTLYLLLSNRNSTNDYWIWDGTTLYHAGGAAPNGVTIQSTGENYSSLPSILAYGGHGSGMTFTPTVQAGGIVNVQIDNPGTGYEVGDVVQLAFSGGGSDDSAILFPNLAAGTVAAANITSGGSGYTVATATIAGGGGTGATGTPIISSGVSAINVTNGGSAYTDTPLVTLSGGGGTGAEGVATIVGGIVTSIDVSATGTGYTSAPTVAITGGGGTGAAATSSIDNGVISGITITNPGSGYISAPGITIAGDGTGATAVSVLSPASVVSVGVFDGGSGFVYAPNITFVGGNGSGATGVVKLTATSIAKVNVVAGGQNYAAPPVITFTGGGGGTGAKATAILGGGQVIGVTVTNGGSGYTTNVEVVFTNAKNDPGSGAGAVAIFAPTSIAGVQMSNFGLNYTDAPQAVLDSGANHAAYAQVSLMPFGVSGASIETFQSRVWIADPAPAPFGTQPPGGNWEVSAPGSFIDFATSDGGVLFTNSDAFLQTRYTNIRQSNGYLYFFGDGSISVVSNINTSGSPATTSFNYQNVDPQAGLSWRDAQQDFGRTLIIANETGAYGLYGGAATKISEKLDELFDEAIFPPAAGALTPTAAVATLFNIKHYLLLMTMKDPDTGLPVNKMITWNEKEWVITSQTVALNYIGTQKVSSKFQAWGTDGSHLYPLFDQPSPFLTKRLNTKLYGGDNPLMIKDVVGMWLTAQDQSAGLAGVNIGTTFNVTGLAIQTTPVTPNVPMESVPNFDTGGSAAGIQVFYGTPNFQAPPPFWPLWATGGGGAPFVSLGLRMTTTSPDFILGHLMIGYTETAAYFSGT